MDEVNFSETNNIGIPSTGQNRLQSLFKKKLFVFGIIGICSFLGILFFLFLNNSQKKKIPPVRIPVSPTLVFLTPTPSISIQLQKAITEAQNADKEYAAWQTTMRTNYPWFKKLPLATEKYFVYFDIERKIFIGFLYPASTDNTEEMKKSIVQQLVAKGVTSIETYTFNWKITPKK